MTMADRILEVLRSRSTLDQPVRHHDLFVHAGLGKEMEFDLAMQSLIETRQVDVTWSRAGSQKRQAEYTATSQRATQTETLIGDTHD